MRVRCLSLVCSLLLCPSVTLAATEKPKGVLLPEVPLADLPSSRGKHIEQIRQQAPGQWINLGAPEPDPECGNGIGRSWSTKMPFSGDLRGAFLYGEGKHGAVTLRNGKEYYNDDLFFYDVNAHRWVCLYPGTEIGAYDLTINADGFEVDERGFPIPVASSVHAYAGLTYDTDRHTLWHLWNPSNYWRKRLPEREELLLDSLDKLNALGNKRWGKMNQASPWAYDTQAGHWWRYKTEEKVPKIGHGAHLIYLPPKKELFFLGKGGAYLYRPKQNEWQALNPAGPPPPRPIDAPSCYDAKRHRIYVAMGSYGNGTEVEGTENRLWAYDVAANTWIDLQPKGKFRPSQVRRAGGTNVTLLQCNSREDVVLYLSRENERGIHIYSPEENRWILPEPIALPEEWGKRIPHGFYDPGLNRHFFFVASDSSGDGSVFSYRFSAKSFRRQK